MMTMTMLKQASSKPNQNTRARGRWLEVKGGREGEKKRRDIEASNRGDGWMEGGWVGQADRPTDVPLPLSFLLVVGALEGWAGRRAAVGEAGVTGVWRRERSARRLVA